MSKSKETLERTVSEGGTDRLTFTYLVPPDYYYQVRVSAIGGKPMDEVAGLQCIYDGWTV